MRAVSASARFAFAAVVRNSFTPSSADSSGCANMKSVPLRSARRKPATSWRCCEAQPFSAMTAVN